MFTDKPPSFLNIEERVQGPPVVPTWSFSRLMNFERCAYTQYLDRIMGVTSESGPAAERGTKMHQMAEDYIQGMTSDIPKAIDKMTPYLELYRAEYEAGNVLVEEDWGFTDEWDTAPWSGPTTWLRMKLDVLHFESETCATAADWKSGKRFGNEIKHNQQGQLYAIGAFMRYPKLEYITTKFLYFDLGEKETLENTYTREQAMRYIGRWTTRGKSLTTADEEDLQKPEPSIKNCKWCNERTGCKYRME